MAKQETKTSKSPGRPAQKQPKRESPPSTKPAASPKTDANPGKDATVKSEGLTGNVEGLPAVEPEVDRTTLDIDDSNAEGQSHWQGQNETPEQRHARAVLGR